MTVKKAFVDVVERIYFIEVHGGEVGKIFGQAYNHMVVPIFTRIWLRIKVGTVR